MQLENMYVQLLDLKVMADIQLQHLQHVCQLIYRTTWRCRLPTFQKLIQLTLWCMGVLDFRWRRLESVSGELETKSNIRY